VKPRLTKQARLEQDFLDTTVQRLMSLSGAQVSVLKLSSIYNAARDSWRATVGAPLSEREQALHVAVAAAIAAVRVNA
jgi:hypothetical protein